MARLRSGWHLTPSFIKCFEAGRRLARRLHRVRLKAGWHAKVLLKHAPVPELALRLLILWKISKQFQYITQANLGR